MIFYYSGCGNSRWVAEQLAAQLGEELRFIPDQQREGVKEYAIAEGESLGFVFPIYSWAAPQLVTEFVEQVKWQGKASYVWMACTCGDEMGMTHKTFAKTLRGVGLDLQAVFCFQMPNTYLCFPGFHLDNKELEAEKLDKAEKKMPEVVQSIRDKRQVEDIIVGSLPRLKSYVIKPGFVRFVSDKKYRITEDCIGCGLCAKVCPLHNIEMVEGHPHWQGHCTQCMACYHHCPKNAVQYASYTKGKGQYFFGRLGD